MEKSWITDREQLLWKYFIAFCSIKISLLTNLFIQARVLVCYDFDTTATTNYYYKYHYPHAMFTVFWWHLTSSDRKWLLLFCCWRSVAALRWTNIHIINVVSHIDRPYFPADQRHFSTNLHRFRFTIEMSKSMLWQGQNRRAARSMRLPVVRWYANGTMQSILFRCWMRWKWNQNFVIRWMRLQCMPQSHLHHAMLSGLPTSLKLNIIYMEKITWLLIFTTIMMKIKWNCHNKWRAIDRRVFFPVTV